MTILRKGVSIGLEIGLSADHLFFPGVFVGPLWLVFELLQAKFKPVTAVYSILFILFYHASQKSVPWRWLPITSHWHTFNQSIPLRWMLQSLSIFTAAPARDQICMQNVVARTVEMPTIVTSFHIFILWTLYERFMTATNEQQNSKTCFELLRIFFDTLLIREISLKIFLKVSRK